MMYRATLRGKAIVLIARGDCIEDAAQHVANRLRGRSAIARRTTGDRGLSGWFTVYRSDRRAGGLRKVGPAFHVMRTSKN